MRLPFWNDIPLWRPIPECGDPNPVRYTFWVTIDEILASIDAEIAQLRQARALLSGNGTKKMGALPSTKKRKMGAASRKKIADAQRKRWAKQKAAK